MSNDKELASWAAGLDADDEAKRTQTVRDILSAIVKPNFKNAGAALNLLQGQWWPLSKELAPQGVAAVLTAVRGLSLEAPELEDASLLLGNLCREDASSVEALKVALKDPSAPVRRAAAGAAGRIGQSALGTVPLLIEALRAPEEEVGGAALESLGAMGALAPEAIAPALLAEADTAHGARRYLALAGLRGLVEDAHRAGRPLEGVSLLESVAARALGDEQPPVRLEAAALLGMARSPAAPVNEALAKALLDSSPDVAAYAAIALLRRGADAPDAHTAIRGLLFSEKQEHRLAALSVLEGLEPSTSKKLRAVLDEAAKMGPADVRDVCGELCRALDVQGLRRGFLV